MKRDDYFWVDFDTFELSNIFGGSYRSINNWLEPKTEPNLACPNPRSAL